MRCLPIKATLLFLLLGVGLPCALADPGDLLRVFENPTPGDDRFGISVAAVGTNVLVGAYLDDGSYADGTVRRQTGIAYLFDGSGPYDGSSRDVPLASFHNPTPAVNDRFGRIVSAVGESVVVGAAFDDACGDDAGAAYLFDGMTGHWLESFPASGRSVNPALGSDDNLGFALAGSENMVLVGAYKNDLGATNAGVAYLFDVSTGGQLRAFANPAPHEDDYFGSHVAMDGANAVIGAYRDDPGGVRDAGVAYLFDASGPHDGSLTNVPLQVFRNPAPSAGDRFGEAVAVAGNDVVIGVPSDDGSGQHAGAAYLFDATTGDQVLTFPGPTNAAHPTLDAGACFGISVAMVGNSVLVGAMKGGPQGAGAAYLFDADSGDLLLTIPNPDPQFGDDLGTSVTALGSNILVGAVDDMRGPG